MMRLVLAGRSGSLIVESDLMSSPYPAWRASPVGTDEKSSLNWMFSRLSPSSYPCPTCLLLSFGPSVPVPGFGLSVDSNLSASWSASLALPTGMTYYALC